MNVNQSFPPAVIWLTGLSGAGKTTIANELAAIFISKQVIPVVLDGDEIRRIMQVQGFSATARKQHNMNVGRLSALFEKRGHVVIAALISPYHEVRDAIRAMCSNFIEVYVATDLATCIQRDPKGLYRKALAGEITEFTGISAPYFPPLNPEITIFTTTTTAPDCARQIFEYYYEHPQLYLPA